MTDTSAKRDIPIIFSAPMVLALLSGRKTMTRRLALRQINTGCDDDPPAYAPSRWQRVKPGDLLWVRENIWLAERYSYGTYPSGDEIKPPALANRSGDPIHYSAHGTPLNSGNSTYGAKGLCNGGYAAPDPYAIWRQWPSIHMPRWASRLTLEVTAVKIEYLQDISKEDAIAEGIAWSNRTEGYSTDPDDGGPHFHCSDPRRSFESLFRTLHGDKIWDSNPEVVAPTFTVHHENITSFSLKRAA